MEILSIVITVFIMLELSNVMILYFKPDSKLGNGIAVFDGWEESKKYRNIHEFIKYLVYWVAGTKLIFIVLLLVILITGSEQTKFMSAVALIFSIASFYWRLYPIIKKLDARNQITPKGYSKTLGIMIGIFICAFCLAVLMSSIL